LIEIGLRQTGNSSAWDQFDNPSSTLDVRHQALYVKSKRLGTVWLGHTSEAVDGIADICLGCTISSSHEANLGWGGFQARFDGRPFGLGDGAVGPSWADIGAGNNVASDQARRQLLRYISPEFAGFVFSADWGAFEDYDSPDNWSVALRYANEFNGVRVAGGIGYHRRNDDFDTLDYEGWGASLSFQHVATGLFVAGSYGEQTDNDLPSGRFIEDTTDGWSVIAGFGRKFSPLGTSTFWVRYGEYTGNDFEALETFWSGKSEVLSLGVNQKIDAAAMEVYVSYYHVSGDVTLAEDTDGIGAAGRKVDMEDFDAVLFGARIQF
jgi:hypothetical protein